MNNNNEDTPINRTIDDANKSESELLKEIAALETKLSSLKDTVRSMEEKFDGILLKQIEILAVFVAVISLVVTNLIGIDAFSNIGMRGLIKIDLIVVISIITLLLGVKYLIIGSGRKINHK